MPTLIAPPEGFRKVVFSTADGEKSFNGFTDGSTWNGWANIWVTKEVHEECNTYCGGELVDEDDPDRFEPDENGLISYANGYCMTIDNEPETIHEYHCSKCGGVDLYAYANVTVTWDIETQGFSMEDIIDDSSPNDSWCRRCNDNVRGEFRDIPS